MIDIQAALTALSSVREFTKLVIGKKIDAAVTQKAIELSDAIISLQGLIFSLHEQNALLLQEKKNIEDKLVQMKKWEITAAQYQLKKVAPGVFVYSLKEYTSISTPSHWICPNCYESRKRSILQRKKQNHEGTIYECLACRAEYCDHTASLNPSI